MSFEDNAYLVARLKKGEEKAFMYLLDQYHQRLNAYALSLVDDPSLAQDIVQNVFVKTWQFREKLNPKYRVQSFLYKAVYNEFINSYRKNQAVMLLEKTYLQTLEDLVESTDDPSLERMTRIVKREIENLPPKCREIFTLSKKEGLTNREISEHLQISIKAVEAQITKAFGILREKLGKRD